MHSSSYGKRPGVILETRVKDELSRSAIGFLEVLAYKAKKQVSTPHAATGAPASNKINIKLALCLFSSCVRRHVFVLSWQGIYTVSIYLPDFPRASSPPFLTAT